jgi:hypothetical protein
VTVAPSAPHKARAASQSNAAKAETTKSDASRADAARLETSAGSAPRTKGSRRIPANNGKSVEEILDELGEEQLRR